MEDYTKRTIPTRINSEGEVETYRTLLDGREIITNSNGDAYIEVDKAVYDEPLPDELKYVISQFYPSIILNNESKKLETIRDVFPSSSVVRDDERVCFLSGIFKLSPEGIPNRMKHSSDYEFEMFVMALAEEDLSNISAKNNYQSEIEV